MAKSIYKVRNWSEYNKSLIKRGSINFWFPQNMIECWKSNNFVKQRGGQEKYSDIAIRTCLIIRSRYNLTLRATQGFVQSFFEIQNIDLKVPNYTRLSRRAKNLNIEIPKSKKNESINVVVDSTGFKIYGEGEWKVRQYGYSKRRTWTKLHIGVNPQTHEIVGGIVTSCKTTDNLALPEVLNQISQPICAIALDGAYDKKNCYKIIKEKGALPIIPPRRDSVIKDDPILDIRNFAINYIKQHGDNQEARKKWKIDSGYHMRSIVETAMFRLKTIFPNKLQSRKFDTQKTELKIRMVILNKMTINGMPDSYKVS